MDKISKDMTAAEALTILTARLDKKSGAGVVTCEEHEALTTITESPEKPLDCRWDSPESRAEDKAAKHTPGPMDVVEVALETARIDEMIESASMELDWSDTPDAEREDCENKAVAMLRAAPELLAALERVLECHRLKISLDTNAAALEQARAAIRKARAE